MSEVIALRLCAPDGFEALDQTLLPHEERYVSIESVDGVREAIANLRVRGAPLLGLVGACGMAIAAETSDASDAALKVAAERIAGTRPTAVDLGALVKKAVTAARAAGGDPGDRRAALWDFAANAIERQDSIDRALGKHGARVIAGARTVLTHCNTGALATGGIGTALAAVRCAWEAGTLQRCFVTETRPLLQGARLTMWELQRLGIPATLLPDTAVASLLASGGVGAVITGADRVAANGDAANKVGTLGIALAAAAHGVPMYIAAPRTTFDPDCADGTAIPIEFRDAAEVGGYGRHRWAPSGVDAYNPAFDVTSAPLIAGFVTERGVLEPPFGSSIADFCQEP